VLFFNVEGHGAHSGGKYAEVITVTDAGQYIGEGIKGQSRSALAGGVAGGYGAVDLRAAEAGGALRLYFKLQWRDGIPHLGYGSIAGCL